VIVRGDWDDGRFGVLIKVDDVTHDGADGAAIRGNAA
jgi:hypothetical protein